MRAGNEATGRSCCRHLGGHSPFAFEFRLVPLKGLLPAVLELVAVVVFRETVLGGMNEWHASERDDRGRTAPQNSTRQWGHWPTMRRTAELQGVSAWSWQRFLMAIVSVGIRCGQSERGRQVGLEGLTCGGEERGDGEGGGGERPY